jgi:hypothetical protein
MAFLDELARRPPPVPDPYRTSLGPRPDAVGRLPTVSDSGLSSRSGRGACEGEVACSLLGELGSALNEGGGTCRDGPLFSASSDRQPGCRRRDGAAETTGERR